MSPVEMEAGPELNAAIAERVMGWRRVRGSFAGSAQWNPGAVMLVPPGFPGQETTEPVTYFGNCPNYSTNMVRVWDVVQKLQPKWWVKITADLTLAGLPVFECEIGKHGGGMLTYHRAPDAALAICRVALEVAGFEEQASSAGGPA